MAALVGARLARCDDFVPRPLDVQYYHANFDRAPKKWPVLTYYHPLGC